MRSIFTDTSLVEILIFVEELSLRVLLVLEFSDHDNEENEGEEDKSGGAPDHDLVIFLFLVEPVVILDYGFVIEGR